MQFKASGVRGTSVSGIRGPGIRAGHSVCGLLAGSWVVISKVISRVINYAYNPY